MPLCDLYDSSGDLILGTVALEGTPYRGMRITLTDGSSVITNYAVREIDFPVTEIMSTTISSTGPVSRGYQPANIALKVQEIALYYAYELSEATDDTEYAALSAAQKATYGMLISMGHFDLSTGTAVRAKLWAMFTSGTTTRANLDVLVGAPST